MRFILTFFFCALLSGCLGYEPDQRFVGRYQASTGEVIDIRPEGRILLVKDRKEVLVGLLIPTSNNSLSIHVVGPDTAPLVGATLVFSADLKQLTVDWANTMASPPMPTSFKKE